MGFDLRRIHISALFSLLVPCEQWSFQAGRSVVSGLECHCSQGICVAHLDILCSGSFSHHVQFYSFMFTYAHRRFSPKWFVWNGKEPVSSFAMFVQRHVEVNEVLTEVCLVFIFAKAWKTIYAEDVIYFYDFERWVFTNLKFPLGNDIQRIFSLYPGTRTLKNWITFQRNVFIHQMPTGKLWNQVFLLILSHSKLDIYSKERAPKETPLLWVIIGSFSIDNGNSSENATFRVNSRFFQFAENWCLRPP